MLWCWEVEQFENKQQIRRYKNTIRTAPQIKNRHSLAVLLISLFRTKLLVRPVPTQFFVFDAERLATLIRLYFSTINYSATMGIAIL